LKNPDALQALCLQGVSISGEPDSVGGNALVFLLPPYLIHSGQKGEILIDMSIKIC
jgi:hypothetical protein